MSWLEIAALAVLLLGVGAGGYLVAQRPTFWVGLGSVLLQKAWPYISAYVSRRMTPEEEAAFRQCMRQGGEWDPWRKRCK